MSLMLKEILEQPQALRKTFQAERAHPLEFMRFTRKRDFRLVVLVARGTSDKAARLARYLTGITTGIPASLSAPSVHTLYRANVDYRQALVVGISQSGEGTDINLVLEAAKRRGGYTDRHHQRKAFHHGQAGGRGFPGARGPATIGGGDAG